MNHKHFTFPRAGRPTIVSKKWLSLRPIQWGAAMKAIGSTREYRLGGVAAAMLASVAWCSAAFAQTSNTNTAETSANVIPGTTDGANASDARANGVFGFDGRGGRRGPGTHDGGGSNGGGNGGSSSGSRPTDPGVRGGTPGAGGPLLGLGDTEKQYFDDAKSVFQEVDAVPNGLGPRFNLDSCSGCHSYPSIGGTSPPTNPQVAVATTAGAKNTVPSFITANGPIREARFVRNADGSADGSVHALFVITGRSDAAGCKIAQPNFAAALASNNVVFRIPTPVFGLGLVENVPDSTLQASLAANAQQKRALGISGHFNINGNDTTIARFGWKAQNKSLLLFSGEAYNVEMGVTNDLFQNEREGNPNCQLNAMPESVTPLRGSDLASPSASFQSDIDLFAGFMRMTAPPTPASGVAAPVAQAASATSQVLASAAADVSDVMTGGTGSSTAAQTASSSTSAAAVSRGSQVFSNIGCQACHTPTLTTGKSKMTGQSNVTFQPFSDFAVHDMGSGLADGVTQGGANGNEFRTAPLWGVGQRIFFLHDGRTKDLHVAIQQHASRGSEANTVISNYNMLPQTDQQSLLAYLRSL
jgi:CxxC motif-containing protein (DUF1111 family)